MVDVRNQGSEGVILVAHQEGTLEAGGRPKAPVAGVANLLEERPKALVADAAS